MRKLQHQTLTPTVHKLDEAVYVTTSCTRLYLRPVELQLCLALGFAPIRLAVLLCWQVWIRRSTGVGISWALSGESGRRTAGTPFSVTNHLISSHLISQPHQHDPGDAWSAQTKANACVSLQELTGSPRQCSALPHQPCSPRPNIAQKEATASSSLLLGPNPFHQPPQCGTYTWVFAVYSPRTSPH